MSSSCFSAPVCDLLPLYCSCLFLSVSLQNTYWLDDLFSFLKHHKHTINKCKKLNPP
jgi:hypothetical protein